MQFSLYKPNSKTSGAAFSWQMGQSQKGPTVYVSCVKQKSWDAENKSGTFFSNKENPDQSARLKLNEIELGGFISAIRVYGKKFSTFHSFENDKSTISFAPYTKSDGTEAFSLTVTKNGLKIGIGVELAEAEVLRVFLEKALEEIFFAKSQTIGRDNE